MSLNSSSFFFIMESRIMYKLDLRILKVNVFVIQEEVTPYSNFESDFVYINHYFA